MSYVSESTTVVRGSSNTLAKTDFGWKRLTTMSVVSMVNEALRPVV